MEERDDLVTRADEGYDVELATHREALAYADYLLENEAGFIDEPALSGIERLRNYLASLIQLEAGRRA